MKYCPLCKRVFEDGEVCPRCDNKDIREAQADDKVFLLRAEPQTAYYLLDKLTSVELDYETVDIERLGDSPFSGKAFIPDCEVYVKFEDYDTAEEILNDVFKDIEVINAPPTKKGVLTQILYIGIFFAIVLFSVFAAQIIGELF